MRFEFITLHAHKGIRSIAYIDVRIRVLRTDTRIDTTRCLLLILLLIFIYTVTQIPVSVQHLSYKLRVFFPHFVFHLFLLYTMHALLSKSMAYWRLIDNTYQQLWLVACELASGFNGLLFMCVKFKIILLRRTRLQRFRIRSSVRSNNGMNRWKLLRRQWQSFW